MKRYTSDGIRTLNGLLGTQATVGDDSIQVLASPKGGHDA